MKSESPTRIVGEFVLIVAGVMVALAGDSWRESLAARELEREYLGRMIADVENSLQSFESVRTAMEAVLAHGYAVAPFLRGEVEADNPIGVLASVYRASHARFPDIVDQTYAELTTGPGLGLIRNRSLRIQIAEFHSLNDRGQLPDIVAADNLEYRNAIRRVMPAELQTFILDECPFLVEPVSCRAVFDESMSELTVKRLIGDPDVEETLNLWLQSIAQEIRRADGVREEAESLLMALNAELQS